MIVVSYDGHILNDSNYKTIVGPEIYGLTFDNFMAARTGKPPTLGFVRNTARQIKMQIFISGGSSEQLARWFDATDQTPKQLIVEDLGGANDRYFMAVCRSLTEVPQTAGNVYFAVMDILDDQNLRSTTETTINWAVTSSGDTENINAAGTAEAKPIYTIKPTSGKASGYGFRRWVPLRWNSVQSVTQYPIDVAMGNIDGAALITAGKLQSDGDDLRVQVNGVQVDRWVADVNTAVTKIWANFDFSARMESQLSTAFLSTDTITEIEVFGAITAWPESGTVLIDNGINQEAFSYTGKDTLNRLLLGVTRAINGTTARDFTINDLVYVVQNDIWILYGNVVVSAPTVNDNKKPIFDLSASDNQVWSYELFGNSGITSNLTYWTFVSGGGFYPPKQTSVDSFGGVLTDPWDNMGIIAYVDGTPGQARFYNPLGIVGIDITVGRRYFQDPGTAAFWSSANGVDKSDNGTAWTQIYAVPEPTAATVQTWTHSTTFATQKYLRLYCAGGETVPLGYEGTIHSALEIDQIDITLTNYPTVIYFGSEESSYELTATITNQTTGLAMTISGLVIAVNDEIEIDTYQKTIKIKSTGLSVRANLQLSTIRTDWLDLIPGNNSLEYIESDVAAVTVTIKYRARYYE